MMNFDARPLVSVCVPLYNHGAFIQACVSSLIQQSYVQVELIIIDDGSQDDSAMQIGALVNECENRFVRFRFMSRENRGLASTLNQGLAWAEGEYFFGIASDDIVAPDKASLLVDYLQRHPSEVAVCGSVETIDSAGQVIARRARAKRYSFQDILLMRAELPAPGALIRTQVLRQVGGYTEGVRVEDWDVWLRLADFSQAGIVLLPSIVAQYRVHGGNTWKAVDLMQCDQLKIVARYVNRKGYRRAVGAINCAAFRNRALYAPADAKHQLRKMLTDYQNFRQVRFYHGLFILAKSWWRSKLRYTGA